MSNQPIILIFDIREILYVDIVTLKNNTIFVERFQTKIKLSNRAVHLKPLRFYYLHGFTFVNLVANGNSIHTTYGASLLATTLFRSPWL